MSKEKSEDKENKSVEQTENNEQNTSAQEETPKKSETGSEDVKEETVEEVVEEIKESSEEEVKVNSIDEVMEYRDKLLRKIAEFENYKKRTSEEFLRLLDTGNQDFILKILPVLDDLERMEKNFKPDMKADDLKKGVDMISNKFKTILTNLGLKEMEVVGKEFDPNLHEALLQMESKDTKANIILDQHEKGYMLKDKIVRHSKVIVAK